MSVSALAHCPLRATTDTVLSDPFAFVRTISRVRRSRSKQNHMTFDTRVHPFKVRMIRVQHLAINYRHGQAAVTDQLHAVGIKL